MLRGASVSFSLHSELPHRSTKGLCEKVLRSHEWTDAAQDDANHESFGAAEDKADGGSWPAWRRMMSTADRDLNGQGRGQRWIVPGTAKDEVNSGCLGQS
jgi:hypothetical protein